VFPNPLILIGQRHLKRLGVLRSIGGILPPKECLENHGGRMPPIQSGAVQPGKAKNLPDPSLRSE
jgi:hypothetical protein